MIGTLEKSGNTVKWSTPDEPLQIRKILVATDFSPCSERAMEYALGIARRYKSEVFLTHVVALDPYAMATSEIALASLQSLRIKAVKRIQEIQDTDKMEQVPYRVVVEEGPVWPTLEWVIEREGIDLVVTGTSGEGGVSKFLLGSTAEAIFRQSKVPVLTVGPGFTGEAPYEPEFRNILFATDFGLGAEREGAYAFSLAQEHRSRLTVLHVIAPDKNLLPENLETKKQAALQQMREVVPTAMRYLCWPQFRTESGSAVDKILKVADECSADLIVMGAKHMKGMANHQPNTKAYRVASLAKCPVLTIRS